MVTRFLQRMVLGPSWKLTEQAKAQPQEALPLPTVTAIEGATITLRLMSAADSAAMLKFAQSLPANDLLFLRRDITRPDQIEDWVRDINAGLVTTVLAVADGNIAGYATVASEGLSWTQHVRELRVMVSAAMRGKHLGRLLTEQAFAIARQQGAKKMLAQMTTDQRAAIAIFESMGFETEARLRNHVVDRDGHMHDLQIMSLDIDAFEAKIEIATTQSATELFE